MCISPGNRGAEPSDFELAAPNIRNWVGRGDVLDQLASRRGARARRSSSAGSWHHQAGGPLPRVEDERALAEGSARSWVAGLREVTARAAVSRNGIVRMSMNAPFGLASVMTSELRLAPRSRGGSARPLSSTSCAPSTSDEERPERRVGGQAARALRLDTKSAARSALPSEYTSPSRRVNGYSDPRRHGDSSPRGGG